MLTLLRKKIYMDPVYNEEEMASHIVLCWNIYQNIGQYSINKEETICPMCNNIIAIKQHIKKCVCRRVFHRACIDKLCLMTEKDRCVLCCID